MYDYLNCSSSLTSGCLAYPPSHHSTKGKVLPRRPIRGYISIIIVYMVAYCNSSLLPISSLNQFQQLFICTPGIVRLLIKCSCVCSECIFYSHCPYAVVASRSMAIVVDPQLKLIMFLFLSCNVLCSQCSPSP